MIRNTLIWLFFLGSIFSIFSEAAQKNHSVGIFLAFDGELNVTRNGETQTLNHRDSILSGDWIESHEPASALLSLSGATVVLAPNTRILVRSGNGIEIAHGAVRVETKSGNFSVSFYGGHFWPGLDSITAYRMDISDLPQLRAFVARGQAQLFYSDAQSDSGSQKQIQDLYAGDFIDVVRGAADPFPTQAGAFEILQEISRLEL